MLTTLGWTPCLEAAFEPFAAEAMVTLDRIEADVATGQGTPDWLLPVDAAFPDLPLVRLDEPTSLRLRQGRTIEPPAGLSNADGPLWRVYDEAHGFLGMGELGPDGRLKVVRLFVPGAGSVPDALKT